MTADAAASHGAKLMSKVLATALCFAGFDLAHAAPAVNEVPTGGQVTAGQASIHQSGSTLNINQTSNRAAVNWHTFNVGSGATVNIDQPNSSSVILNRVMSNDPSQIFGRINANGQVFLTNPSGVYFARGSSVNVGGIVATTHSITDADFMAGINKFDRNGATGSIINEGDITTAINGYVALMAPEVRNNGVIIAQLGTVALAAGEVYELQFDSNNILANIRVEPSAIQALVENGNAIQAPGGLILLSARAANSLQGSIVNNSGALEAGSLSSKGGRIILGGDEITLTSTSQINVTGATGGGEVLVGGDWQGSGDLYQATKVSMQSGASIDASATQNGDGGKVVLWSDVHNVGSITKAHGSILARGGVEGGDGGKIETSGHHLTTDGASVNTLAPQGRTGLWLLDPNSYTIAASGGDTTGIAIATNLNTTDMIIQTGATALGNEGDIIINDNITYTGGSARTLTFKAHNDITLNSGKTISSSTAPLNTVFWARNNTASTPDNGTVGISGNITTNGGGLWIGGGSGSTSWQPYSGTTSITVGDASAVAQATSQGGVIINGSTISTGAGNVYMAGQSFITSGYTTSGSVYDYGVFFKHSSITTSTGNINITGDIKGNFNYGAGLWIDANGGGKTTSLQTGAGNITLTGSGTDNNTGGSGWRHGLLLLSQNSGDSVSITSTSGAISLTGAATFTDPTTNDTSGLQIQVNNATGFAKVVSQTGNISLIGSNSQEIGQQENAIRFTAANVANAIRIGYDGSNVYSGNILIEGNSILQRAENAGSGSLAVQSTGGLTIQSVGATFTQLRAGASNALSFDNDWNFGTALSSFTLGKSTNTKDLALSNALTVAGPISLYGSNINLGANLTSSRVGAAILAKASGNITANANLTFQTNNGSLTFWSDADANADGHISLGNSVTLNTANGSTSQATGGGAIILAGGLDNVGSDGIPDGYAFSTTVHGISLGTTSANVAGFYSGGGDVLLKGKTSTTSSTGDGTFHGLNVWGGLAINSGQGSIKLTGESVDSYGIEFSRTGGSNNTLLTSGKTSGKAISITGITTAAATYGLVFDQNNTENILATGGGDISITGTGTGTGSAYGVWLQNTNVLASSGAIAIDGGSKGINVQGASTVGKSSAGITASSSNVTLTGDRLNLASALGVATTGTLTVEPFSDSFTSAVVWPLTNLTLALTVSGLTIGKATNTSGITIESNTSIAGPINIYGGNIAINALLAATSNTITLSGTSTVTDGVSGYLVADKLVLLDGAVTLNHVSNNVAILAASGADSVDYTDADALGIGTVGATNGVASTGAVSVATKAGDLTVANNVSGTSVILNAGKDTAAGTSTGGNILISGSPTVTATTGNAKLYTGSISGSTGLTALIGSGSGKFRYNSDEAVSNFSLALGATGKYAIYRERPIVNATSGSLAITYGDSTAALTNTSTGLVNGDITTYEILSPLYSTSSNIKAGSYTLDAEALSLTSLGYLVSSGSNGTLTVNTKALTLSGFAADDKIYNATTVATIANAGGLSGVITGDTVTASNTGATFNTKNVGVAKTVTLNGVAISGVDSTNYSIVNSVTDTANITQATLTVSGLTSTNKVYDAALAATLTGTAAITALVGDTVTLGGTATGAFADKNVGTAKTVTVTGNTISGTDAANYNLVQQAGLTADITKADLTVSGLTATNKTYDTNRVATLTGTAAITVLGTDSVTLGGTATGTFADKNVGTAKTVTVTGNTISGTDAANYNLVQQAGLTADITQATLTVSGLTSTNKVYDATTAATLAGTAAITVLGTDSVTLAGTATGAFADKNVGTAKAVTVSGNTISGTDAANYNLVQQAGLTADITKATLTVSGLTSTNKVYDTTTVDALTGTAAITVLGTDSVTLAGTATGAFADKNVGTAKTVTVTGNTISGTDAANYNLVQQAGLTADITKATLTVSGLTSTNKVYDTTTVDALTGTAAITVLGTDSVTLGGTATGTFADKNVGTAKAVTVSGSTISGTDAANYNLVQQAGLTANITQATLTVSGLTSTNKVYDATTVDALTGTAAITALVGDTVTLDGTATGTFADKNVGTAKAVTVTGNTISGTDAANYNLVQQAGLTADITKATLTVSGLTSTNKVYDAALAATLTGTAAITALVGDTVTLGGTATGAFADKNVGTAKTVAVTGSTISGTDAANYNLVQQAGLTADITRANLTVIANNDARFFSQSETLAAGTNYSGVSYSGFANGETSGTAGLIGTLAVVRTNLTGDGTTDAAGIYALTPSGLSAGNYAITNQAGSYTIVPAGQLLVKVTDVTNTYGTATTYAVNSAQYLSGMTITTLANPAAGNTVTLDGVTFALAPVNGALSTGNVLKAGSYQLGGTVIAGNTANFSNDLVVVGNHFVTQKALTASAAGGISKIYDGTTAMAGVNIALANQEVGDVVSVSGNGVFDNKNVGLGNKGYSVSELTLAGVDAANYYLSGGASFSGTDGTISAKPLTVTYTGVDKIYDGTVSATATTTDDRIAGDQFMITHTDVFGDKNVATAKPIYITGVSLSTGDAANYTVASTGATTANITRLSTVTWIGGATGNWFDPANWAGGAVPDLSNVANVIIPAGVTVTFDTAGAVSPADASGAVNIDSLGSSAGSLTMENGTLNAGGGGITLDTLTQSGGTITDTGGITLNTYGQTGGSTTTNGDFTTTDGYSQGTTGMLTIGGNATITDTTGGVVLGNISTTGTTTINSTGGNITEANGTSILANGDAIFNASNGAMMADVTLDNSGNNFGGTFNAYGANVTVRDDTGGLILGDVMTTGNAAFDSNGGGITQTSGTSLVIGGTTTLDATSNGTTPADITLNNGTNNFEGAFNANGANVSLSDLNAIILGNITASGTLNILAGGNVTQNSGVLNIAGVTTMNLTTGVVTLATSGNYFGGGLNVTDPAPVAAVAVAAAVAGTHPQGTGNHGQSDNNDNISPPSGGLDSAEWNSYFDSGDSSNDDAAASLEQLYGDVIITLEVMPSETVEGIISALVSSDIIKSGSGFSVPLPKEILSGGIVAVTLPDGSPLPAWITFNAQKQSIEVAQVPENGLPIKLLVSAVGKRTIISIFGKSISEQIMSNKQTILDNI